VDTNDQAPKPEPDLECGLPRRIFAHLRDVSALSRLNIKEGEAVFAALYSAGFKVARRAVTR
jgi:hypothetical protein